MMKPLLRLLAAGTLWLTVASSPAASTFEGKISQAISAGKKGGTQTLDYAIKGQKLRLDITVEDTQVTTITDMDKLEVIILMPEQKQYMVQPVKKPLEQAAAKAGENTAELEMTGKTETILGYNCSQALIKDKGTVTELWLVEGLAAFPGLGAPAGGKKGAHVAKWEEALKGKSGFPLRVISRDAKGKETFKMEATKVEPGPLPDSVFLPPAGYEKFKMPSLGDMMKGLGGG